MATKASVRCKYHYHYLSYIVKNLNDSVLVSKAKRFSSAIQYHQVNEEGRVLGSITWNWLDSVCWKTGRK